MNDSSEFHEDINYIIIKLGEEGEEEKKKQAFVKLVHDNVYNLVTISYDWI